MRSTNYAYVNGRFLPESEATVSIFDRGFLYGDGCFETMRVYAGRIFRPWDHFDRLLEGLDVLDIESPFSPEELSAVCRALIRYNSIGNGVARVYRTRDSLIATMQHREFTPGSIQAMISKVQVTPSLSCFKTANRLPYIMARQFAEQAGMDDAILVNGAGHLVELTTSNLFIVKNGELLTPSLRDGALPGITRRAIMTLASVLQIVARERSLTPKDLETADEVFATNSVMEIAPVLTWGQPGKVTRQLHNAYQELVAEELG